MSRSRIPKKRRSRSQRRRRGNHHLRYMSQTVSLRKSLSPRKYRRFWAHPWGRTSLREAQRLADALRLTGTAFLQFGISMQKLGQAMTQAAAAMKKFRFAYLYGASAKTLALNFVPRAAAQAQLRAYRALTQQIVSPLNAPPTITPPASTLWAGVLGTTGSFEGDEDDPPVVLGVREGFRIWRVGVVYEWEFTAAPAEVMSASVVLRCGDEYSARIRAATPEDALLMRRLRPGGDRVLMSWGIDDVWLMKDKRAICVRVKGSFANRHEPKDVPKWGCDCGIWGVDTLDQGNMPMSKWEVQTSLRWGGADTFLIGKIHGKEKVVEATSGFRCQEAEVVELYDHYPDSYDIASRQWIYDLAARYDVPVRPYPLWTTPSG